MLKHILFSFLLACFQVLAFSQGVDFASQRSWGEVKYSASVQQKYIFIDCYATWCAPCKKMDREVFASSEIGSFFNKNFLSIKVQLDSTEMDNENIKKWYNDANKIRQMYEVTSLPTFLIFAQDGTLIGKEIGYLTKDSLIAFVHGVINGEYSYGSLLKKYYDKTLAPFALRELALSAKGLGNDSLADKVANEYKNQILDKLSSSEMLNKTNLEFMVDFGHLVTSSDPWFTLYYKNSKEVNKVLNNKDYAERMVFYIIDKEYIRSILNNIKISRNTIVNWRQIKDSISRKYNNELAAKVVRDAKISWYTKVQEWDSVALFYAEKFDKEGIDTSFWGRVAMNNICWDIFLKHVTDTHLLKKSITWMSDILLVSPHEYSKRDTYANLLFKVGNKKHALMQEELAIQSIKESKELQESIKQDKIVEYTQILKKLEKNEPTW